MKRRVTRQIAARRIAHLDLGSAPAPAAHEQHQHAGHAKPKRKP